MVQTSYADGAQGYADDNGNVTIYIGSHFEVRINAGAGFIYTGLRIKPSHAICDYNKNQSLINR